MARRLKLLSGLSTLAAAGALALGGCGKGEGEGAEGEGAEGEVAAHSAAHSASSAPVPGKGEGEGAEGEGGAVAADKPGYLASLMMLRGHLKAGAALYAAGSSTEAAVHMKHPHDEIYASLAPVMASYGAEDFSDALTALSDNVLAGAALDKVEEAHAGLRAAVNAASAAARPTLKDTLLAAARTLAEAGAEYDIGVKDGALVNAKEYQDAYGFIATVVEALGAVEGSSEQEKTAVAVAREQAALALAVAPGAIPPATLGRSTAIHGAAARIELAALALP